MQGQPLHQGLPTEAPLIWMLGGTADGPPLAAALLERGWRVRLSVVSAAATRVYAPHPRLELRVGDLAEDNAVERELEQHRPRWVLDATHPFALRISERLERVCRRRGQPLERLQRPGLGGCGEAPTLELPDLAALADLNLRGERLLLAIGSRQLGQALAASNADAHFARILDRPASCSWPWRPGCGTTSWLACAPVSQPATTARPGPWNGPCAGAGASVRCCAGPAVAAAKPSGARCAASWGCGCCCCNGPTAPGAMACPWIRCWRSWGTPDGPAAPWPSP